jgi:hypothetical protein
LDRGTGRSGTIGQELCERGFPGAAVPDEAHAHVIKRAALLRATVAEPQLDPREALRGDVHRRGYQRVKR